MQFRLVRHTTKTTGKAHEYFTIRLIDTDTMTDICRNPAPMVFDNLVECENRLADYLNAYNLPVIDEKDLK